jgi:hypothetical protein
MRFKKRSFQIPAIRSVDRTGFSSGTHLDEVQGRRILKSSFARPSRARFGLEVTPPAELARHTFDVGSETGYCVRAHRKHRLLTITLRPVEEGRLDDHRERSRWLST